MRRPARRAAAAAVLAMLGACTSLAPRYERPAPPVAERFPAPPLAGSTPAVGSTPADEIGWADYFTDPRQARLIGIALSANRDLRAAVLAIEQSRALYRVARADRAPTVSAALTAQRQTGSGGIESLYTAGLAVSGFELDLFGRVKSLADAALARYLGTEEARRAAQVSLVASVAAQHVALLSDDAQLEVTRRTLQTREESLRLTQLKFDHGAISELDLRLAESLLESARVSLAQLERQRALDENALALLLGTPVPADLPAGAPLDGLQLAGLPAGLPSEVLVRRPDVREAEQSLIAANADIGAARAAFFPRITLTGSVGFASTELSRLFEGGDLAWSFAPQALLPIFDLGRRRANLEVTEATRAIAVAQYEKAIQTAFREVADALASRAALAEQQRAQQAQTAALDAAARLADLRYRAGASSFLEALDAQRSLYAAQIGNVQVQAAITQNAIALYRALGGGSR